LHKIGAEPVFDAILEIIIAKNRIQQAQAAIFFVAFFHRKKPETDFY
jgi:hypothetical protein